MTSRLLSIPLAVLLTTSAHAQLFDRLQSFTDRFPVGDPDVPAVLGIEGPKAIATADLDKDGTPDYAIANSDGTVTVLWGDPDNPLSPPLRSLQRLPQAPHAKSKFLAAK